MDPDATLPPPDTDLGHMLTVGFEGGEPPRDPPAATGLGDEHPELPGYEVQRELGRGGMGVVYLARQVSLNRSVALKLFQPERYVSPQARQRFQAEAESAARIAHPGIVQVYEIGQHAGRPYFAQEFCPGGSLAAKLAGTPLPPRQAAELVEGVARAVQAAHDAGVIHRDLKPDNVLFGADRAPKVADFGLAKPVQTDSSLTTDGAVLGTPSYMAPEQARGDSRAVGPAADVYALGAVLYECLTGRPPFRAATLMETLTQVMTAEPVSPRKLVPAVPRDLEPVCLKCLEKEPGRRYPSAAALADDLRAFLDGRPITARPLGPLGRAGRWGRRNKLASGAAGIAVGVLFAYVVDVVSRNAALRRERNAAVTAQREAEVARDEAEAQKRKAKDRLDAAVDAIESMIGHTGAEMWTTNAMLQDERRKLLEDAVAFYERLATTDGDDPVVKRESARSNVRAGRAWLNLGDNAKAEAACRKAVALHADLLATQPDDPSGAAAAAEARAALGHTLAVIGNYQAALVEYTAAKELAEKAVAGNPADAEAVLTLIRARTNLSNFAQLAGDLLRAVSEATAAVELAAKLAAAPDAPPAHRVAYAGALVLVGNGHLLAGRYSEAGKRFDEAEKVFTGLGRPPKGQRVGRRPNGEVAEQTLAVKAQIDTQRGAVRFATARGQADIQAAAKLFQSGLGTLDQLLQVHPKSFPYRLMKFQTLAALAETHNRLKDTAARDRATAEVDKLAAQIVADAPSATWVLSNTALRRTHALIAAVRGGQFDRFAAEAADLLAVADTLPAASGVGGVVRYNVACGHAEMAKSGPEADREAHAVAAVRLLDKLADEGYFRRAQAAKELAGDTDLDPLRTRDDFKAILKKAAKP